MSKGRFTSLVGCTVPVQLAAMGGIGTTELAAAVAGAGGLGMVPAGTQPAAEPCGVNFLMPFSPSLDDITAAAGQRQVVEFFYADPRADVVSAAHGAGAVAGWQVGSVAEAVAAEKAGCDYVVAQGTEAGGHVRGSQRLDDLLAQVLSSVRIPVVAAGGIATAERTAALIRSGADAVRVGTRFVASPESGAHPDYIRMVLAATADDTVLTEWFSDGLGERAPPGPTLFRGGGSQDRVEGDRTPLPRRRPRPQRHGDVRGHGRRRRQPQPAGGRGCRRSGEAALIRKSEAKRGHLPKSGRPRKFGGEREICRRSTRGTTC